jgi:hypothetical protein
VKRGPGVNVIVDIDDRTVSRLLSQLPAQYVIPALRRAVLRASNSTAQLVRDTIREQLNVRASELKRRQFVQVRRTTQGLGARVLIKGYALPLDAFNGITSSRRGLTVKVLKGGPSVTLRHAFIIPGPSGPLAVERQVVGGKRVGRLPLRPLYGPAPVTIVSHEDVLSGIGAHFQDRFDVEFTRDLTYRLRKVTPPGLVTR